MTVFQAVIYGVIQGATEFLPVSSSAHLVLLPWLAGWPDPGLAFDTSLHLGTTAALLVYFRRDWLELAMNGLTDPRSEPGRTAWLIALACVPAGVAGLALADLAETAFRHPLLIAFNLALFGVLLHWADDKRAGADITLARALGVGLAQALAIVPGVSRSGITITAGLWQGLEREKAMRFSFLLAAPITLGAGLHQLTRLGPSDFNASFAAGIAASGVTGFLAIHGLLRFSTRRGFSAFMVYRLGLSAFIIGLYFFR